MSETTMTPVAVDLFAGAGGLGEGLMSAGVRVAAAVELHPQPSLTYAFNHPGSAVLVGDIRQLPMDRLEAAVRTATGKRKIDVVVGGPPCQGFSTAGKKVSEDPRNSLFNQFVRVVEHFRPKLFLLENVPGFKKMHGGRAYTEAVALFTRLGYTITDDLLNAMDYGVPQGRLRFVMVGWLKREDRPVRVAGEDPRVRGQVVAVRQRPDAAGDGVRRPGGHRVLGAGLRGPPAPG